MKALLIIDMQVGSFKPYTLRYDTDGLIARINDLSRHFRANGDMIIFIQHDGTKENCFVPGSSDWGILPELLKVPTDTTIDKVANDSFYQTTLQLTLVKNNITELYITGCATDFCVDTTIKSALSKEYNITVVADGHTTADRRFLSAEKVIQYYNWIWGDMTPAKHRINVRNAAEILAEF